VLGILSAWNATKPSIGATGRVSRCGADTGSTGAAVSNCAPNTLAAISNVFIREVNRGLTELTADTVQFRLALIQGILVRDPFLG